LRRKLEADTRGKIRLPKGSWLKGKKNTTIKLKRGKEIEKIIETKKLKSRSNHKRGGGKEENLSVDVFRGERILPEKRLGKERS